MGEEEKKGKRCRTYLLPRSRSILNVCECHATRRTARMLGGVREEKYEVEVELGAQRTRQEQMVGIGCVRKFPGRQGHRPRIS